MACDPLCESAWLKWGQAMHHARALQEDIDASPLINGNADPLVAIRTQYHAHRHGFGVYATEVRPWPVQWGLLLGDIANNYRCALDHLAWALVSRGKTPPAVLSKEMRAKVYFPIAEGRGQFNGSLVKKRVWLLQDELE
jgi:hypothetical protein